MIPAERDGGDTDGFETENFGEPDRAVAPAPPRATGERPLDFDPPDSVLGASVGPDDPRAFQPRCS
jgi:hypothetical protein